MNMSLTGGWTKQAISSKAALDIYIASASTSPVLVTSQKGMSSEAN